MPHRSPRDVIAHPEDRDAIDKIGRPWPNRAADGHGPVSTPPGECHGIIDRAALSADLAVLAASGLSRDALRAAVLARLKDALDSGRRRSGAAFRPEDRAPWRRGPTAFWSIG